jgi:hypothetical protein
MAAVPDRNTEKRLSFEVIEPHSMGFSLGRTGLGASDDSPSSWLSFSIVPDKFPVKQNVWLLQTKIDTHAPSESQKSDEPKRRLLTASIKGTLHFRMLSLDPDKAGNRTTVGVGALTYVPEYSSSDYGHNECYEIEVYLPEKEFTLIRSLFVSGKPPSAISIWTPDIAYGVAPDGSDKVWNVGSGFSTANIVGFSISFSTEIQRIIVGVKKTENETEKNAEDVLKTRQEIIESRHDIQLLCFGLSEVKTTLSSLRKQLNILIVIAAIIALFIAMRFRL